MQRGEQKTQGMINKISISDGDVRDVQFRGM